ncbi:MAG: hypothetical protein MJD61_16800 [Proteobacteria bacterium]|nr:hypothetical protein [Pseudomonadota bacterium]
MTGIRASERAGKARISSWGAALLAIGAGGALGLAIRPARPTEAGLVSQPLLIEVAASRPDTALTMPSAAAGSPVLSGQARETVRSLGAPAVVTRIRSRRPRYYPRAPGEWQGMLVDMNLLSYCGRTGSCPAALACSTEGQCSPCKLDSDCEPAETCVLDRCVSQELASCRTSADCARGQVCILSGLGHGPRGNEGMRAFCFDPEKEPVAKREPLAAPPQERQPIVMTPEQEAISELGGR